MCRNFFRRKRLKKDSFKDRTGFVALKDIHTVAAVMDAGIPEFEKCRKNLEKFCRDHNISLTLLYVDMRKFKKDVQMVTELQETVIRKDLNWTGRPDASKTSAVLSKTYDLYICLVDSDSYCIEYISKCARARFKIGWKAFKGDPYDFVVSSSSDGSTRPDTVNDIFGTIKEFLTKIG